MEFSITNEKDILVMKLLNYFITKKNYSPIIIHGIQDEIWLENPNEEYRVIRIVTKNIYNDEQYNFDVMKTKNILSQIKKRTLKLSLNVLSIYTSVGDNFSNNIINDNKNTSIIIDEENKLKEIEIINKFYPDLKDNIKYDEIGFDLINKITGEISKKNIKESEKRNNMFKSKKTIVTYLLIILNVIIFMLMYVFGKGSYDTNTLIKFGANYIPYTKSGDYYRIITSAFLHIGEFHLFFNMYALYIIGREIEQFYGRIKYILIYFFSAIMGSLFTLTLSAENTVSAGASGAIFGLFGAMLYFGFTYRGYIGKTIINQTLPVVLINLFIGLTTPGIGNAAHIGGLIGGYMISMGLGANIEETKASKINGMIISIILTIFMIYMSFFK